MRPDSVKPRKRRHYRMSGAFALVELLVVLAVIAIIMAILVPALKRVKETARSVTCHNNLRQLGLAANLYADSHDMRFPSFRKWLFTRVGDLTTGQVYPYLNSRKVYLCPTDKLELASARPPSRGGRVLRTGGFGDRSPFRDYSYGMNCGICHDPKISSYLAPSQTMLYMEGSLQPTDYSGQIGPSSSTRPLATRHGGKGHLLMADLHQETLDREAFDQVSQTKRFWLPTNHRFTGFHENTFARLR